VAVAVTSATRAAAAVSLAAIVATPATVAAVEWHTFEAAVDPTERGRQMLLGLPGTQSIVQQQLFVLEGVFFDGRRALHLHGRATSNDLWGQRSYFAEWVHQLSAQQCWRHCVVVTRFGP